MPVLDVMAPVVQGTLNAFALANQLRRTAMEQERLKRAEEREARQAQIQDFQLRDLAARAGRPVRAGMVEEEATFPELPGVWAGLAGQKFPVQRKAREVQRAKLSTGEVLEFEPLSRKEQTDRLLAEHRATLEAEEEIKARVHRAQSMRDLQEFGIAINEDTGKVLGIPPGTKVMPQNFDDILRAHAAVEALRGNQDPVTHVQFETDKGGVVRGVPVHESGKMDPPQSLGKIGKPQTGGVQTENQRQTQAREEAKAREATAARITALEQRVAAAHARAQRLGEISKTPVGQPYVDEAGKEQPKMTDLVKARYASGAREAKTAVTELETQVNRLRRLVRWRESTETGTVAVGARSADPLGIR